MIVVELWNGQGLGNQLHCYITARAVAERNNFEFGVQSPERFKGSSFINLNSGLLVTGGRTDVEGQPPITLPDNISHYYREHSIRNSFGDDVTPYDQNIFKVGDNTKLDGLLQGEEYFLEFRDLIRTDWLKVDLFELPENLCVINFRGGEYTNYPRFFLTEKYWDDAITNMLSIRNDMSFVVVTDDVYSATRVFSKYNIPVTHDMSTDYRMIQSAHYLILSNSSFAFYPAWLNTNSKFTIAPRYWGRHNVSDGFWSIDQNYTKGWTYQDRDGNLSAEK